MFQKMRRSDRLISTSESESILTAGEYGVLSTVGENGYAYGVPLSYAYENNGIYFHCAFDEGHKLDNIKLSNKVCFTVVGKTKVIPNELSTKYESVIAFGKAFEIEDEEKINALILLLEKYSPDHIEKGKKYIAADYKKTSVIKIEVEQLTGKALK